MRPFTVLVCQPSAVPAPAVARTAKVDFGTGDLVLALLSGGYGEEAQIRQNPTNLTTMGPATAAAVEADQALIETESSSAESDCSSIRSCSPASPVRVPVELFTEESINDTIFQRESDDWSLDETSADDVALALFTDGKNEAISTGRYRFRF